MKWDFQKVPIKSILGAHKTMEENKMFSLTWLVVKKIPLRGMVSALMVIALTLFPLLTSADEDPCRERGIYIGNQTMLDMWYTRNGGPCTIWVHAHILTVKPEDTLIIYTDRICNTEYCPENPTYDVYKSLDANQNCRVRILPNCTLSDM
jgi:hypothetical protein